MQKFTRIYLMMLALLVSQAVWAQHAVSGKVIGADDKQPIPGVNIVEKGTTSGTVTDLNGDFTISVPDDAVLVISSVGYVSQEISVGGRTTINISFVPDVKILEDVVVVGYGSQEKKDITGATVALKSEDFNQGIIASPEQLIQGRAAGVQITSSSGEPGAASNIRIRGTSSVNTGNGPLYVVDGVPLSNDDISPASNGQPIGDSPAKNPLNFLNPNDIASIDVLKDASATAIYGSRGANGVVMITTKSGRGNAKLDYSYNLGVSTITKKYDLLGKQEYLDTYGKFNPPDPKKPNDVPPAIKQDKGSNTDWQSQVLRTAITQGHNLSYGSGDKAGGDYRFSFGTLSQQGIIKKSDLVRYTARFNGTKKFIKDKLKVSTQLTVASTKDGNVPISSNSGYEGDLFSSAFKFNPSAPVRNPDGTYFQPGTDQPNPVAMLNLTKGYTNTLRSLGNFSAEYEFFKGFSFKTVLGFDRSTSSRKAAFSKDLVYNGIGGIGRLYINDVQTDNRLWENYFVYDTKIGERGTLKALLGYSYQSFGYSSQGFAFSNFRTNDLNIMINNYASAEKAVGTNSSDVKDELQSFYGRVNYSYHDRYIVTATLRADGSTKFGKNNRYGYFPSAAFKWRISEEEFMPKAFDEFSLRLGIGTTGNQNIPHNLFETRQRYSDNSINTDGNYQTGGLSNVAFANPNLKWESTTQTNIGIDYGFLDNRIRGSIDLYNKKTNNLLIQVTSAQPAVNAFVWKNLNADVINQGVEFTLEADAVANNNFKWTIAGNVAYNKNLVKNYNGIVDTGAINGQGLSGAFAERIANNQPLFAFYLRDFAGYDANGNSLYTGGDFQKFTGKSPLPKTTLGLTNNLKYKNFDLNIFFSGQFGQYIYNNTQNGYFTLGSIATGKNVTKDVVSGKEGILNAPDVSTRFLQNGSFLRLQNVTLGYNINFNSKYLSNIRLTLTGQSLFVITKYNGQDPEVSTNKQINGVPSAGIDYNAYPRARTITFGVSASF